MTLLVLFDVDGTLLLSHDPVYVEADRAALLEVYGVAPDGPDVPGDTAPSHTRRALRSAGWSDDDIDAGLDAWCEVFSALYVQLLAERDTSSWQAGSGAREVIAGIERRALLTGNPEPVARARVERLGLGDLFARDHGAFGCEREDRVELLGLALRREGDWPAERTVEVGDTPLDVSSAHAISARCVAITTGRFSAEELAGADRVIAELRELPAALESLAAEVG